MNWLNGIRVVDLSSLIAGPYCAMLLGDLGAQVVKVEHPSGGDPARSLGPPFVKAQSCLFMSLNRNKESLTLDLNRPEGRAILGRLIEGADVLIENFLPEVVERMGLGYEQLSRYRPDIVYCSLSAFGEGGPLKNKPGTDPIFQGMGGIMMISGHPDDPPIRIGCPVADVTAGIFAACAIAAALFCRAVSGKGKKIDISIFQAILALQTPRVAEYMGTGKNPARLGRSSAFATPSQYFETLDGYVNVSAFSNKFWKRLCQVLGLEGLAEDEDLSSPAKRMINRLRLLPVLERAFRKRTTAEWMEILDRVGIPNGPIYTYRQMFSDEALQIADYLVEFTHPLAGTTKAMGVPIRSDPPEPILHRSPPLLGEHTETILGRLGFSSTEIDQLRETKII